MTTSSCCFYCFGWSLC